MRGHRQKKIELARVCCYLMEAALISMPCFGSELEDSVSPKVREIREVTVTSRRSSNKVSTAVPVQTLSGTDLEQLGVQNMADAVRRFAGTNVKDYGGIGGLKTVSVRNMGASHTAVSYDGTPVSNCQAGQIDIGRFSLDNVGMLSLAIGQNEDMLQSARLYSSAAVLGIWTERPEFSPGRSAAFKFQTTGGSFGYVNTSGRWWMKYNERLATSVEGNFMRADGNYPYTLVNGKFVSRERRNNSAINSWHGEANVYYTFPKGGELQAKGYYFYSKRGLPGAITLYNPVSNETLWDKNAFFQARYKQKFGEKWQLQAIGKYNYGWNRDREFGPQFTNGIYQADHHQNEYYLSATGLYRPIENLSIAFAQDGIINTLKSTMVDCPDPTRYTSLTALSVKWQPAMFTITGTAVGTYISEEVKSGSKPHDTKKITPSISVSVKPWEDRSLYFRLMYKNTFRMPSFNDLYYYRLGSRSLRPEFANEYNVGFTWSRSLFPAMDYMTVTIDGYFNDVTDKIVAVPTTYAWLMSNFGKVHVTGMDVTLSTAFSLPFNTKLIVSGAYTLQRAVDMGKSAASNYKSQLPYTPRNSGNVAAMVETPWVNLGYSMVAVGLRYYMPENIRANEIDAYTEHTLSLSREFQFGKFALNARAELVNFTDKQYEVIKFYPMPGRSWRISCGLKF